MLRLNPDCIRDILFAVEENTGYREELAIGRNETLPTQLLKYDFKTVVYHVNQCILSGLVIKGHPLLRVDVCIADLSPAGHEFLANIRADNNWSKVKKKASEVGSQSLSVLAEIAGQVIASMLTQGH